MTTHQAAHVAVLEALDRMRDCIAAHCMDIAQDERWHGILAQCAEARAAIADLMKQVGWQPIETAPKDEYEIILGSADSGVTVGFWHDGSECYGHRGGAGWFSSDDRGSLLTASNFHATHWMPLPAAPTEASR